MCRRLIFLVSFVLVLALAAGVAKAAPYQQDPGPDGIVSIEAENFDENAPQGSFEWKFLTAPAGFSGTGLMRAVPDDGTGYSTDFSMRSPRLDFKVKFVKTGIHYVWVRSFRFGSNDEYGHVGLDGSASTSDHVKTGTPDGKYEWYNDRTGGRGLTTIDVTGAGIHTINVWMGEAGWGVDKLVLTTNPDFTLTGTEELGPPESLRGARVKAFNPSPADGATDVSRDIVLGWTPGELANSHDVYAGTVFNDVNNANRTNPLGVLVSQGQGANTYDPGRLEFDRTYYWRVDEVNGPPDFTVHKGNIWSFTVEPFAYPVAGTSITATASSQFSASTGPQNTINGSGLDDNDLHSTKEAGIWLSSMTGSQPTWIQYEFNRIYQLHQMWVWNFNQVAELVVGFGFKNVTIEYSTDGTNWATLANVPQFAQAPGRNGYAHNTTIDFGAVPAKYVRLTANSNFGGILPQYGLSEVRFFYIPVFARDPDPAFGAIGISVDNVTFSWRPGREAAKHNVYFSDSNQAVIEGTTPVTTVSQASYGPLSFDLGKAYYWRVDEVNQAEIPATWQGDVWNFSAQEYLVVDDFEDYNDFEPDRIFDTWIDGWNVPANGSQVGYAEPPFAEKRIIHSGKQSMPLSYDNTAAGYSEATANAANLKVGKDWTKYGIKTFTLYFYGDPNNSVTEKMYVKLNGTKVTYNGDAANLRRAAWHPWNIELSAFGVNLRNVTELSIGLERSGAVGGRGKVYFDDIRLYPLR